MNIMQQNTLEKYFFNKKNIISAYRIEKISMFILALNKHLISFE